ncbi:MAG: DegT/DnrJ/EryC1/StrS family aminotransferase [Magnetococcales bacterium]|nr:DegT/DnrJ/EryC1/StrS family aminotransferase [Magnetococcales bacterium]
MIEKVPQFMPWVGESEYKAIADCFEKNWITEGPKSKEFVDRLLKLIGAKYGVLAPNGTLAIYLALKSLGIGPGDKVMVPDFTFIASANAVVMVGATPIFIDVNHRNFQIDLSAADHLVTPDLKAIMPVHIYGTVCDMDAVADFAKRHKLLVVEDAAQAIGVHYKGRHAGTFGDTAAFSFFADKTLTTAEGGLVVTNDKKVYEQLLYLRNQGRIDRGTFIHPEMGFNFRMTDIQSAVGLVQLDKLNAIRERKLAILEWYQQGLSNIKEVTFFTPDPGAEWIPFRVGILCDQAHELLTYLEQNRVEPRTFFYPLHMQPALVKLLNKENIPLNDEDFPNALNAYNRGICLPTFATMSKEQVGYVCNVISQFFTDK